MSSIGQRPRFGLPTNPRQWLVEKRAGSIPAVPPTRRSLAETDQPAVVVPEEHLSKENPKNPVQSKSPIITPIEIDYEDLLDCYHTDRESWKDSGRPSPITAYKAIEPTGSIAEKEKLETSTRTSSRTSAHQYSRDSHSSSGSEKLGMRILTSDSYGKTFTRKRRNYPVNTSVDLTQMAPLLTKTTTSTLPNSHPVQTGRSFNSSVDEESGKKNRSNSEKVYSKPPSLVSEHCSSSTAPGSIIHVPQTNMEIPQSNPLDDSVSTEEGTSWDEDDLLEAYSSWDSSSSSRDSISTSHLNIQMPDQIQVNVSLIAGHHAEQFGKQYTDYSLQTALENSHISGLNCDHLLVPPTSAKSESSHYSMESEIVSSS